MTKRILDFIIKFLMVLTVGIGLLSYFKPELVKESIEWIRTVVSHLGYWNYLIIFLSSFLEVFPVLGAVLPGQNIMIIVGGFFAQVGLINLLGAMFIASFGAVLGNSIGFILGKYYGEDFFKEYGLWVGLGTTEVKYLKEKIHTRGPLGVILGKFHNLARSFVPFIAGSMEMNNRSFHIYNFISSIVRAVSMILLGILFAQYYEKIIDYLFTIMFVGMLLFLGYKYLFQKEDLIKYWKDKNEEIDEKIRRDEERALLKKHQKDAKRKASTGTLS